jgi:hypothetical protein
MNEEEQIISAAKRLGKYQKNPSVRLWGKILDVIQEVSGLCECGCGERTEVAKYTDVTHAVFAGRHKRFIQGHGGALAAKKTVRYLVDPVSGCWIWQLSTRDGYGITKGTFRSKDVKQAHRVIYEEIKGPIPEGLVLDHLCHNRLCVNPDHLEPVTTAENNRRKFSKPKPIESWEKYVSSC